MKNSIGRKLKKARVAKKITQKELSEKLGCTEVMISRYELGVSQVSIPRLKEIAKILGKSTSYFIEGDSTVSTTPASFKQAFVFDLDDTLVDGRQFCGETIARVITAVDPSVDFDYVCELHDSIRGMTIEDLYKEILDKVGVKADISELLKHDYIIQDENIEKMTIFEGVVDILEFLKSTGKKVYICTNRKKDLMDKLLDANKILPYFDEVISCVDSGYKKPNPYCLVDLVNRSGYDIEEFIYFGDSEVDSQFAQNAGIEHIIFDQYLNRKNLFKKLVNMFLENRINGTTQNASQQPLHKHS